MEVLSKEPYLGSRNRLSDQRVTGWNPWRRSPRVCIDLDADCLRRLLGSQQLHVQDFSCADAHSKECVRRLLLQTLTSSRED